MPRGISFLSAALLTTLLLPSVAIAAERIVATSEELSTALAEAARGDAIILKPGVYKGGLSREGLRQVLIRSADPAAPAVIEGGSFGLLLSDPVDVTLSSLVFRKQLENGINIDDAESPETPARGIKLLRILVHDIVNAGNHDGIKMAGVRDFLIDGVTVENWGSEGSAIDFVGCHHGLVQNSWLANRKSNFEGSGVRPKGGSKDITIRANRIELPFGKGRALQAGGSTDAEFFRFVDGESGYEASDIVVEGNVVVGGSSAFSWVNIDGGVFHHNFAYRPGQWVARILNENPGDEIVDTQNGRFHDNQIIFNDTKDEFNTAINAGDETLPASFRFARNYWFNLADPTPKGSTPQLPAKEADGHYGEKPSLAIDAPYVWNFPWGMWIVNANASKMSVDVPNSAKLLRALPGTSAKFEPLLDDPLTGTWKSAPAGAPRLELPAMSQIILINVDACPNCASGN